MERNYVKQQEHLLRILETRPNAAQIILELAISYALTDDIVKAEDTFIKAIEMNPYNQKSFYNYGVFLNSIDDFQSAIIQFDHAIKLQSNYMASHYAKIESLVKLNNLNEAQQSLKTLKKMGSNSKYYQLAEELLNQ